MIYSRKQLRIRSPHDCGGSNGTGVKGCLLENVLSIIPRKFFTTLMISGFLAIAVSWAGATRLALADQGDSSSDASAVSLLQDAQNESHASDFVGPPNPPRERSDFCLFREAWQDVVAALEADDQAGAGSALEKLRALEEAKNYGSAERWSLELIRYAEAALANGDRSKASLLATWAEQLSPSSVLVAFRGARVFDLTGARSLWAHFSSALREALRDRVFLATFFESMTYPALWALTISLFVLSVLLFALRMKEPLRLVGLRLPLRIRGVLSPLLVLGTLTAPLAFGPLWTLAVWAIVVLLVIPKYRWVAFYAAITLGLWAACIPIREVLHAALDDGRSRALLRVSGAVFEPDDNEVLSSMERFEGEAGVLQYVRGMVLLHQRQLANAGEAFRAAEIDWSAAQHGLVPFAKAQQGVVAFLSGDSNAAIALLEEAQRLGLQTAASKLNLSKVAFDLSDTVRSRSLFSEAQRKDPELARMIRAAEERFGDRDVRSMAPLKLPFFSALRALMVERNDVRARSEEVLNNLMPGVRPFELLMMAGGLVLLFLFRAEPPRRVRRELLYPAPAKSAPIRLLARLVPGGSLLTVGYAGRALLVLTLSVGLAMPLLGWPAEVLGVSAYLSDFRPYFVSFAILFAFGTVYVCWHLKEREE